MFMSRIYIINGGTWLYFYLSLYVARSFTNANFGITGTSEMVSTSFVSKSSEDVVLMLICKQVYTCWKGNGSSSV
jgi:hypothetical protein